MDKYKSTQSDELKEDINDINLDLDQESINQIQEAIGKLEDNIDNKNITNNTKEMDKNSEEKDPTKFPENDEENKFQKSRYSNTKYDFDNSPANIKNENKFDTLSNSPLKLELGKDVKNSLFLENLGAPNVVSEQTKDVKDIDQKSDSDNPDVFNNQQTKFKNESIPVNLDSKKEPLFKGGLFTSNTNSNPFGGIFNSNNKNLNQNLNVFFSDNSNKNNDSNSPFKEEKKSSLLFGEPLKKSDSTFDKNIDENNNEDNKIKSSLFKEQKNDDDKKEDNKIGYVSLFSNKNPKNEENIQNLFGTNNIFSNNQIKSNNSQNNQNYSLFGNLNFDKKEKEEKQTSLFPKNNDHFGQKTNNNNIFSFTNNSTNEKGNIFGNLFGQKVESSDNNKTNTIGSLFGNLQNTQDNQKNNEKEEIKSLFGNVQNKNNNEKKNNDNPFSKLFSSNSSNTNKGLFGNTIQDNNPFINKSTNDTSSLFNNNGSNLFGTTSLFTKNENNTKNNLFNNNNNNSSLFNFDTKVDEESEEIEQLKNEEEEFKLNEQEEKELREKEQREKEKKEKERIEKEKKMKEQREKEQREKEQKEKEQRERERKEKEQREKEKKEKERKEKEQREKEKIEKDKKEKEKKEKERKEKEKIEKEQKEKQKKDNQIIIKENKKEIKKEEIKFQNDIFKLNNENIEKDKNKEIKIEENQEKEKNKNLKSKNLFKPTENVEPYKKEINIIKESKDNIIDTSSNKLNKKDINNSSHKFNIEFNNPLSSSNILKQSSNKISQKINIKKPITKEFYNNLLEKMIKIVNKQKNEIVDFANNEDDNAYSSMLNNFIKDLEYKILTMKNWYICTLIQTKYCKDEKILKDILIKGNIPQKRNDVKKAFNDIILFINSQLADKKYIQRYYYIILLDFLEKHKEISNDDINSAEKLYNQKKLDNLLLENDIYNQSNEEGQNVWIPQVRYNKINYVLMFSVIIPLLFAFIYFKKQANI